MRLAAATWAVVLAGLAGPAVVQSAGASSTASATASIMAPVNVSFAASAYQTLFDTSTGSLSIRINGAPARVALLESACAIFSGVGNQCNAAMTIQVANDGTLNEGEGVSVSIRQSDEDQMVVTAMLAYN